MDGWTSFDLLCIVGGGIHGDDGWLRDAGGSCWVSLACGCGVWLRVRLGGKARY